MKNQLDSEKSPYLKQHALNPVWWHAWGAEAFEKAKNENKLIFLSIGYSTCHWCHVMEHESFEKEDVAAVLNESFISIKVDREERPDVDSIYMNILVGLNGHGGWPLNMILTPHREAFFGGTYYPKANFIHLLNEVNRVWLSTPEQIHATGRKINEWLHLKDRDSAVGELSPKVFKDFYESFLEGFDFEKGGRLGSPKFIPSYGLRLLMRYHLREPSSQSLTMLQKTLEMISRGGIYDQLGGGFHRYATDSNWLIPHFEKMLYDQAAMVQLFLEAYQLTQEEEYKLVLEETIEYVLRDLLSPGGGFYSAEDADSEGIEGTFYVWGIDEIEKLLTADELKIFCETYPVSHNGNFEEKNILELAPGQFRKNFSANLISAQDKLFVKRLSRPRPLRDEKILVSWNALMISSLAKSGASLNEPKYIAAAKKAAQFILDKVRTPTGELYHQWIDGSASHIAVLEDYAFLIDALIELYQADFEEKYLFEALKLQFVQDRIFLEDQNYYNSSGSDPYLIKREKSFMDNVTPSGNSMSVYNLLRLSDFFLDLKMRDQALSLLKTFPKEIETYPSEFVQVLMAYDYFESAPKQIAIIGPDSDQMLAAARVGFRPRQITALAQTDSTIALLRDRKALGARATGYVCVDHSCQLPTNDLKKFKELLGE